MSSRIFAPVVTKKLVFALALFFVPFCFGQRSNTFYVDQFPGSTVADKTTAAQAACNPNALMPCVLVFDPSLASYARGSMPGRCAQCIWMDWTNPAGLGITPAATAPSNNSTPYIDPTNPLWGAKGDCTTDDTAAFASIFSTLKTIGGTVLVPHPTGGCYKMSSTTQLAAAPGEGQSSIVVQCSGGYKSATFRWFGADKGVMFQIGDGTNYGPASVFDCGFEGSDATHRVTPVYIYSILNGVTGSHFERNRMRNNIWDCVQVANSWIGWIRDNYCYAPAQAGVHFGPGGLGPVNQYVVEGNELACAGRSHIWSEATGTGGSNGNFYVHNDIECTMPTTLADVDMNDSDSRFDNRLEVGQGPNDPSYVSLIFRGTRNHITTTSTFCMQLTSGGNIVRGVSPGSRCIGANAGFNVIDSAGGNTFYGASDSKLCTGAGCSKNKFYDTPYSGIDVPSLKAYTWNVGSTDQDFAYGRVTVAGTDWYRSNSDNNNPSVPTQFSGTTKVVQKGIVSNVYAGDNQRENNAFWICLNAAGCSLPFNATDFRRLGWLSSKWHGECAGSAPASGSWNVGDFCENTSPSELGSAGSKYIVTRFTCVAAGSPGTWVQTRALTGN